ncbi:hypothetical protein BDZ90DRAFT_231468 [Jaminaea rosea]|uniref:Uncharacterized protein n=1 Tax=Jaminaea rosea TaxID=1569628 RepID=A0A316UT86_9BASI|nr:hypothetical protein BDZ90DRAFT_231468 [Jaminaea rosea]PWN28482.1 hypothetical protein BDZ90DRAFT_231468 [Jaminaea rosea]
MPTSSSSSSASAGVAGGSRAPRPPTTASSSSSAGGGSSGGHRSTTANGGPRPASSTSSVSTSSKPAASRDAKSASNLSSKRSVASSASSRPAAPKVQVRQPTSAGAATGGAGRPGSASSSSAPPGAQQRALKAKASTSSLSTARDDTTMKRVPRPQQSAAAGPSKTPGNGTAAGSAGVSASSSSRQPVRGNLIFHQLKADVLRGDASAFFPQLPDPVLDEDALLARLVRLSEDYLHPEGHDICSASFYAFLALSLQPNSVPARRLRARCFLDGGQGSVLPFVPGQGSKRAGALAALATLEEGNNAVFADMECAKIWSQACVVLDRREEAEQVLKWCLASPDASTSTPNSPASRSEDPPELVSAVARQQAVSLCELGFMAKEGSRADEAEKHFLEARSKDPWNWRAWLGLCQLGVAPLPFAAFVDSAADHDAVEFLDQAIIALGGTPSALEPAMAAMPPPESSHQVTSSSSSRPGIQRPGTRPTSSATTTAPAATAKRTKSGASPRPTSSSRNNAESSSQPQRLPASASATPAVMSRTLSQAKTNERPPSSLSNGSAALPEKEKQVNDSMTVTRDSLRRSTRAQATPATTRRNAAAGARGTTGTAATGATRTGAPQKSTAATSSTTSSGSRPAGRTVDRGSSDRESTSTRPTSATQRRPQSKPISGPASASTLEPIIDDVAESIRQATLKKAAEKAARWRVADQGVLKYLRLVGGAYKDALDFKGERVLRAFSFHPSSDASSSHSLPPVALASLLSTPEIGCLLARVHHDMAQYSESLQSFEGVLRAPRGSHGRQCLLESMDIYSLVLYHLNRQSTLSALAQDLLSFDPDAVQTHIAIGNLFSLNASPSIALRSFRRACLSAPRYAYSYTLAGHECLTLNQPLKALRYFRQAAKLEKRHWNGWSGIGTVLSLEGKWSDARFALSRACSLNGSNAGLHEVLAVVHEMLGDRPAALESYDTAMQLNPKGASAALRKAELLWASGRLEMAHEALLKAVALAPNEARAHLLLAESFMRKGGGSFAPLSKTKSSSEADPSSKDASGVAAVAKAVGEPVAPRKYHDEIARHLAMALDLEPGLSRQIKAMAEGVGATLRGQSGGAAAAVAARAAAAANGGVGHAGGNLGPAMGLPDRSVGSSFSGIDESRRFYDETGAEGEYSSAAYENGVAGASELMDDSMGVLRDEEGAESYARVGDDEDDEEDDDDDDEEDEDDDGDDGEEEEDEEEEGEDAEEEEEDGRMSDQESAAHDSASDGGGAEVQDSQMAEHDHGDVAMAPGGAGADASAASGDGEEEMSLE